VWDILWNWSELVQLGGDAVTYFLMAMVGTILFLVRLVLALFGGDSGDFDVDVDSGTDASFTLFSLLSVMAFIMGAGWMGLAARIDWGLSRPVAAVLSVSFGTLMMLVAAGMMRIMRRFAREVTYDVSTAIGRTARVYMTIPAKGAGQGQVQVSVSGRLMTLTAVSAGGELASFTDVRVVGARDDQTLIVAPLDTVEAAAGGAGRPA
jgi:hypothetical protein